MSADNMWRDEMMHVRLSIEAEEREAKRSLAPAQCYAAFIDRGNGWEQCTPEMSRDTARIYVRGRRTQEKAYPMGKRFKTDKSKRHNDRTERQPPGCAHDGTNTI